MLVVLVIFLSTPGLIAMATSSADVSISRLPSDRESESLITLIRDDNDPVDVQLSQVTPRSLANLYSIDINTVFLREIGGARAYFPDSNNRSFRFPSDVGSTLHSFYVEGSEDATASASVVSASGAPSATSLALSRLRSNHTAESSSRPIFTKKGGTDTTFNLKVVKAKMSHGLNNKASFEIIGQNFISLSEVTATVPYLNSVIRDKWGEGYILVTSDGLPIEDSDGTRGLKFWKVPSRKIFAILNTDIARAKSSSTPGRITSRNSDEDSDFDLPPSKRMRASQIAVELSDIKKSIQSILEVNKFMKYPPGLYIAIMTTFKCSICLEIITPPVIFARCCKSILGCEKCVNGLYCGENGPSINCPLCRSERAFSETCRINGLDLFLKSLQPMFDSTYSHVDSDDFDDNSFV